MRRLAMTAFIIGVFLGAPASAATIQSVKPEVSVNRGQGYQEVVTAATPAKDGDQVMAGPGGRGKIVYSDGCAVDVYPGSVVTVKEGSCKPAKPMLLGESDPKELHCDPKELNCPPVAAVPGTPWFVVPVALAVIVGVGCATTFCQEHKEHHVPVSP